MTRWLLVTVVLMVVFSLATEVLLQDPGYVMIAVGHKTLHMRFWPAAMLFFATLWVLYFLAAFSKRIAELARGQGWRGKPQVGTSSKRQHGFWLHYFEGNWARLLKESNRLLGKKPDLIASLMAAEAAAELGDFNQQRLTLTQAALQHPRQMLAINLVAARLAAHQGDWLEVIAQLQRLREYAPEHAPALRLLAQAYRERGDWPELAALLPEVKRLQATTADTLHQLEQVTYARLLEGAASLGFEALQNAWQGVNKSQKQQPRVLLAYGYALRRLKRSDLAEPLVRKYLRQHWSDEVAALYGLLELPSGQDQLKQAETWLVERPQNAHLLMALGRICWRLQYWGKARDYFDQALQLAPSAQTYIALAQTYTQLGDTAKSHALYEQGLTKMAQTSAAM